MWDGNREDNIVSVEVPTLQDFLEPEDFHRLIQAVNPLQDSDDSGVDVTPKDDLNIITFTKTLKNYPYHILTNPVSLHFLNINMQKPNLINRTIGLQIK